MVGPVLKEAVIAIFFCNIFVNCQDILEFFHPKPGFPQELNEWLSNVQKHKRDFRLIRDIARKHEMEVEEGLINNKGLGIGSKDKYDNYGSLSDDRPKNDIYPHVYKTKNNHMSDSGTSLYKPQKNRLVSKNMRSPIRLRRNLEDNYYDRRDKVEVQPTGKIGEVKRSDDKYPERYVDNIKNSKEHLKKRDIQIDVLNDGKLVKQIKEQGGDSKSIVLNIQSLDEPKGPLMLNKPEALLNTYVPVSLDGNQIGIGDNKIKDFDSSINTETKIQGFDSAVNSDNKINGFDSNLITDNKIKVFDPAKMLNAPERSIDLDNSQMKAKEFVNNYKNLYGANLNLNTDSSIARDNFDKTALVYHVTFTDLGIMHNSYENERTPSTENINTPKERTNTNIEKNNIGRTNFNRNDLRDMSQFWTKSEKNQMQKGINFAQNNWNMKKVPQHPNPVQPAQNNDGFELVKSVVVEENGNINDNNNRQSVHDKADSHNVNMSPNSKLHNKRQLASLEGKVHVVNNNDLLAYNNETISDSIPSNNFYALLPPSNPSNNMGITHIDALRDLEPSTDSIFSTDSLSGSTTMEGKMELANLDNLPVQTYLPSSVDLELHPIDESTKTVGVLNENNNEERTVRSETEFDEQDKVPVFKVIKTVDKHIHDHKVITEHASEDETPEDSENDNAHNTEEDNVENFDENKETESPVNLSNDDDDDSRHMEPNDRIEEVHRHVEDVITKTEHRRLNKNAEPERKQNIFHKGLKIITRPFKKFFKKNKPKYSPVHKKINILGNKSPNASRCKQGYKDHEVKGSSQMECNPERNECPERFSNKEQSSFEERTSKENDAQSQHEKLPKRKRSKHKRRRHHRKDRREQYRQRWKKLHISRDNDPVINPPVKETETIPAFNGRQLKMADYVYDTYLYGPSEEDVEDSDEEVTSKRNARVEEAAQSPVEGDYNDEEDSITVKHKKGDFNIVKKTDNVFANPITTTEEEESDEYYDDDYGVSANLSSQDNKDNKKHDKHKADVHSKGEELANFGRHLHKKMKSPKTVVNKNKKAPINGNRYGDISHELNTLKKMREPRNLPSKNFLEKSEFQQWPKFVISDQEKEENLRKRSLATRKKQAIKNNFPLASKDFFVKSDVGRKTKEANIVNRAVPSNCGAKTLATTEKLFSNEVKDCETTTNTMSLNQIENSVSNIMSNQNSTDSEVPVEGEACDSENPATVHNICDENENFNRSRVEMTTVLPIMHECQGMQVSSNDSQTYEKLDELLNGHLPLKVLVDIFSHVESCDHLKRRFIKGLKRTQHKPGTFQDLTDTSNEESKKLINLMSNIMNRLQITTTCQTLPKKLRPYLKSLTKNRKGDALSRTREMEEIELDDNQNTNNFIFRSSNRVDNLEEKVSVLKDLLVKFNNLPEKCKGRAEPVKEYIENHLGMLNNMLSGDNVNAQNGKKTVDDRSDSLNNKGDNEEKIQNDLVQEQLNSLGLGSKHNFQPKFDLDALIRVHNKHPNSLSNTEDHRTRRTKINSKRDLRSLSGTQKYNRLIDAIRKVSARMNRETKLGEMFGRLTQDDFNGYTDPKSKRDTKVSFESPLVYSF